jgi:hypothetical protein
LDQYPASFASKNSLDPRSDDLPSDSRLWELILKAAQKYDMTLFSGLLFLRQQGCHIVTINDSRYKIEPILGMPGGWASQREYETFRNESMMKYFPKIKELLDCLYQTVHRKVSE